MLKNLVKSLNLIQINKNLINPSVHKFSSSSYLSNKVGKEEEKDEFDYQRQESAKVKNLERMGMIKSHISWPQYNRVIYPPSEDGVPLKNPFVHHMRSFIKYPAKKMWYPALLIRGMSIEEALKQLSFHKLKGAAVIKEVLLEAQDLAIKQHNIEFKSNLWISYSTAVDSFRIKGVRKHRAMRFGMVEYKYCTYYVRLEEGSPPPKYELESETYEARAKEYIEKLRNRFTDKEHISGVVQAKSTVIKQIRCKLIEDYPAIEEYIDEILPKKDNVRIVKCQDHIEVLAGSSGEPLLFKLRDGQFIPVLRLLHKYPFILPIQQVDKGAIKFVLSGANIMAPGLTSPGGKMTPCDTNTVVSIMAEGKQHALAIGVTKMSTEDIAKTNKGIAIEALHYLNDGLWQMKPIK